MLFIQDQSNIDIKQNQETEIENSLYSKLKKKT